MTEDIYYKLGERPIFLSDSIPLGLWRGTMAVMRTDC